MDGRGLERLSSIWSGTETAGFEIDVSTTGGSGTGICVGGAAVVVSMGSLAEGVSSSMGDEVSTMMMESVIGVSVALESNMGFSTMPVFVLDSTKMSTGVVAPAPCS
jgi:hypothetical protein